MREIIDRYADGIFETSPNRLAFSVSRIEASIQKGMLYEGSFVLYSTSDTQFSAYIYSSDMRLVCRTEEVSGTKETIGFVFDSTGLELGDIVKGDIQIVSDAGEYYLPFAFSVSYGLIEGSMGSVRNLFHFANQAQVSWAEAVNLFYSPQFEGIFEGNDRMNYGKYRGFLNRLNNSQAVDDFLISVNKKRPVMLSVDRSAFEFNEVTDVMRCDVQLHKSTWGCAEAKLNSDAAFIQLEKDHLSESDFIGNTHNLVFFIIDEKLHEGRNFGRISITTANQELTITIVARQRARANAIRIERREKRNLIAKLMQSYISFRMKKISVSSWVRDSMKIVERLNALDDKNPISRLYQAQLLLTQKRDAEAGWILEHIEGEMDLMNAGDEAYAYYLYLKSLLTRDEAHIAKATDEVHKLFDKNPRSFAILWTLLYLDDEYDVSKAVRIEAIEKLFAGGIASPVLYIEAYNYYAYNPARVTKLNDLELQVFLFATKQKRFDEELSNQVTYIASKARTYSHLLYKLLTMLYELHPSVDLVEVICALLIKGNRTERECFVWYERGIRAQLRITRLYEYYMYTIPADYDGIIPKSVLMYFTFSNEMDYHHMAFLYANVIHNRREIPEVYESYREKMMIFAAEQIEAEHINANLAEIYIDVLDTENIRPSLAGHLSRLIFAVEVSPDTEDNAYEKVILIQDQFVSELSFSFIKGYAYPTIYSSAYALFYEDSKGRRRLVPEEKVRKLINEAVYIPAIRNFVSDNIYFSMYLCEGRKHYVTVDDKNVEFCRELAQSQEVSERYKKDIRMSLLRYYYDNDQISTLDDFLIHLEVKNLTQRDRADVVQFYVLRGMYSEAYQTVSIYGIEEVSANVLVRICNHMINQTDFLPDTMLLKLCYQAFKNGKYDETTLKYMVDHFAGLTKELRNLWKAAKEFDVECFSLMERLIIQMLYTHTTVGEREDIFEEYISCGSSAKVELAYLSNSAYEYFTHERLTDERVFAHIIHNYRLGEKLNDACRLALLKYYAEEETSYSQKIKEMLVAFLIDFLHRNIYFSFFAAYQDAVPELIEYTDKTVIEYRTNPESRVVLHYILEDEMINEDEYHTEEMRNVFGGIFEREFILFFGENLQYYITEERNGREQLTASDSISVSDTKVSAGESRYSMLNDMVVSKTVNDDGTLVKLMQEYVEADSFARKVFKLR